jgi:hypothetical protein
MDWDMADKEGNGREEMTGREIKVPEGMLKAAWEATRDKMKECLNAAGNCRVEELTVSRISLEAALRWWSENPIVPTFDQQRQILAECELLGPARVASVSAICIEWQRRMFLATAPDTSRVRDIADRMLGRTFTSAEADHLINMVLTSASPGYQPPFMNATNSAAPDPDSEIEDLLIDPLNCVPKTAALYNKEIREAYQRGLKGRHK